MKTQDSYSITFKIHWDYEFIISTKGVVGLIKTVTRQDIESDSMITRYFFDTQENSDIWVASLSPTMRGFII